MNKLLARAAIAGALSMAAVANADAGTRSGMIVGPRGITTFSRSFKPS